MGYSEQVSVGRCHTSEVVEERSNCVVAEPVVEGWLAASWVEECVELAADLGMDLERRRSCA